MSLFSTEWDNAGLFVCAHWGYVWHKCLDLIQGSFYQRQLSTLSDIILSSLLVSPAYADLLFRFAITWPCVVEWMYTSLNPLCPVPPPPAFGYKLAWCCMVLTSSCRPCLASAEYSWLQWTWFLIHIFHFALFPHVFFCICLSFSLWFCAPTFSV